ncbi:hypothetical protein COY52_11115 [Candidatus Desantisbacteria bacterium CG_4_10_14_0_8_um_filter_48_22]|uniref:Divergent polysaccharide deacetylase family protein n=1 Tax=Candidatus Desantisbacteria bacterium CG_4_10_14_0_8_um_filter_48_22 TaxID=1974543 RepID=A0A2M7S5Z5_9BACT|nr:MAG: hypothetical protein COY52_11115 [Candidatus Desantisbacteria bacterium CG_4_10_14_0_8_um_filter_48_22]
MKIGRYILIGGVIALVVLLFVVKPFRKPVDYMKKSAELEAVLKSEFLKLGLSEQNLLETYNEQKSEGRVKWICFTKSFLVSDTFSFDVCLSSLKDAVMPAGGTVISSQAEKNGRMLTVKVGVKNTVTHVLIFERRSKTTRIAFIIDDFGFNEEAMSEFMTLDYPLTFAVLPYLKYSKAAAELAHKSGKEVILHLPLTGIENEYNKNVITLKMSSEEIESRVEKGISGVPYAVGANNHMGSIVTGNTQAMEIILGRLREHGMYFVDSRTTQKTVGYRLARSMGVRTGIRDIFLDMENFKDVEYIRGQVGALVRIARKKGEAIGIGHNRTWTFQVLREELPRLRSEGIELVFASQIVK